MAAPGHAPQLSAEPDGEELGTGGRQTTTNKARVSLHREANPAQMPAVAAGMVTGRVVDAPKVRGVDSRSTKRKRQQFESG